MKLKDNTITIIRQYNGMGIDKYLNGYNLETVKPVQKKFYNGRLCYVHNGKVIGLATIKNQPKCRIELKQYCPF